MRVTKLTLQNFKSFRDVTIPFRPFNVVIGGNASGKSNLVQAFQFLKDIADHGLENAVSLQGGIEFLRNMEVGVDEPVRISVEFGYSEDDFCEVGIIRPSEHHLTVRKAKYTLELNFNASDHVKEELRQRFQIQNRYADYYCEDTEKYVFETIGKGEISVSFENGTDSITTDLSGIENDSLIKEIHSLVRLSEMGGVFSRTTSPFDAPIISGWSRYPDSKISGISVYRLDSCLPKTGTPRAGKADLESDGGNLAIVVKDILRDKEKSRSFHNLIGDLLPHVKGVSVEEFGFNSLMMNFRESYAPERDIPATFVSDGTIGMTAALVAFAFEGNDVTILEEPDRNVHPRLISRLTNLMKDVSRWSQILITTHNPEFVRLAGIENLLLVSRDKKGFSKVTKPADSEIVKTFLSDVVGIDDLFVNDFLTIGV